MIALASACEKDVLARFPGAIGKWAVCALGKFGGRELTAFGRLTAFRRRSGDFMKQLKKTKRTVVLTVKGMAAAIAQDAEAYQRVLDIAAHADSGEGIRQGLKDAKQGRWGQQESLFCGLRSHAWHTSFTSPSALSAISLSCNAQINAEDSDGPLN